jgi:hypothetical protein
VAEFRVGETDCGVDLMTVTNKTIGQNIPLRVRMDIFRKGGKCLPMVSPVS